MLLIGLFYFFPSMTVYDFACMSMALLAAQLEMHLVYMGTVHL